MSSAAGPQSGSAGSGGSGGSGGAVGVGSGATDASLIDSISETYRGAGIVARLRFITKHKRGQTRKLALKALLSAIKAHTLGTRLYMVRRCVVTPRQPVWWTARARARDDLARLGGPWRRIRSACAPWCADHGVGTPALVRALGWHAGTGSWRLLAHRLTPCCVACPLPERVDGGDCGAEPR